MADLPINQNNKEFQTLYKQKLLETFKYLIHFLESNNLNWWTAYGTCLGAIRHKGLIPWDDDIDIYLPRKDFNHLIELEHKLDESTYGFLSLKNANTYTTIGKLFNKKTTYWNGRKTKDIMGVWIDIFPLDQTKMTPDTYQERYSVFAKYQHRYRLSSIHYSISDFINDIKGCHPHSLIDGIKSKFFYSRERVKSRIHQEMIEVAEIFNDGEGNYLFSPCAHEGIKELYLKEWFEGYQTVPFENFTVRVPKMYDEYLTHYFGDYMTPTPIEKRIRHEVVYCNLRERVSLQEVKKKVKAGIHIEM